MKEKIQDSKQILGVNPNTWGDFDKGVDKVSKFARVFLPVVTLGTVATGCVTIDYGTPTEAVSTLESSPMPGTGEFSVLFTPNSLQNLDSSTKEIVSKNLELIAGECKKDLPGMVDGSEKYLYSGNLSNEIFVWGFCDVQADANGPERTVVTAFDWMAGPAGEMTKINRDLVLFDDGTIGYVDTEGNSHAVLKKSESNLIDVYDINENVVASQQMTPELTSFMGKALLMPLDIRPTAVVEPTKTEATATATDGASEVKRDASGNILPNPVGEWTKLPQGENQRILIGPEGSNIVLELDSSLGFSELMFNKGKDDYFIKDGKTPQDRIYEAVNGSLYYYWCSTQGDGCASEPIDMKGKNIDFWSYKNKEAGGTIKIDNGVIFKIAPMWDKSGGQGKWIKLTDGNKVYKFMNKDEFWYEVDSQGILIVNIAIENVDLFKKYPYFMSSAMYSSLISLSAGRNLHSSSELPEVNLIGEIGLQYYPEVSDWITFKGDNESILRNIFVDYSTGDPRDWDANIFLTK